MDRRNTTGLPYSSRRQKHGADSGDRISDLPEPILGHILSNLPIKNAVATGVLSKRWKFLWTTTGNLDFSFNGGSVEQFVQSVNYVMLLHKPAAYFNELSLIWYATKPIPLYVNTWICTAVARDVHKLYIYVGNYDLPLHVQSYLFSSEKLMSLKLRCRIRISPEIVFSLPRLESLELFPVSFPSEESFRKLIDACPVLKRLLIRIDNRNSVAFKCIISSTSLKHLELSTSFEFSHFLGVVLEAPSLEHIYLRDINRIAVQQRLDCLSEASIGLASFGQESRDPLYCNSIVEALHALSCAKTLDFSSRVIRALGCATIKMETRFNRLTKLTLFRGQNCLSAIRNLIELSDNLKHLSINMYSDDNNDNEEGQFNDSNWMKPNVVPTCLSNSLRSVSFHNFDGRPDVVAMIEYILKHGSVLKTINISFCEAFRGLKRKDRLVQLISTFQKKSIICEVKIVDSLLIWEEFNSADSAIDA